MAEQSGFNTVLVSWTSPDSPPTLGYRLIVDSVNSSIVASSSPQSISVPCAKVYTIWVESISPHYPGGVATPVQVTVRGRPIDNYLNAQHSHLYGSR